MPKALHTAATQRQWKSTYCFRQFRKKHTVLSDIYWMSQLGNQATLKLVDGISESQFVADIVASPAVPRGKFPLKIKEFRERLGLHEGIHRLHLLVVCSANFESYLQDAVRLRVGSLGYASKAFTLNSVGSAMAKPVINSSTVPDMLEYIEKLLSLQFGDARSLWKKAYKLRCAAAHNGGVATSKTRRDIPSLGLSDGAPISLSWPELMSYLDAADRIATAVDMSISTPAVRDLEGRWILDELKAQKALPPFASVWQFMHDEYRILVSSKAKTRIQFEVFNSGK